MVIDSSAILAVLRNEEESYYFQDVIFSSSECLISAGNALEVSIVTEAQQGIGARQTAELLLHKIGITVIPFDVEQLQAAQQAFSKYGKGRHPAALNFGDCMAYGLAKVRMLPLLFKGNDFSQTDIAAAV